MAQQFYNEEFKGVCIAHKKLTFNFDLSYSNGLLNINIDIKESDIMACEKKDSFDNFHNQPKDSIDVNDNNGVTFKTNYNQTNFTFDVKLYGFFHFRKICAECCSLPVSVENSLRPLNYFESIPYTKTPIINYSEAIQEIQKLADLENKLEPSQQDTGKQIFKLFSLQLGSNSNLNDKERFEKSENIRSEILTILLQDIKCNDRACEPCNNLNAVDYSEMDPMYSNINPLENKNVVNLGISPNVNLLDKINFEYEINKKWISS